MKKKTTMFTLFFFLRLKSSRRADSVDCVLSDDSSFVTIVTDFDLFEIELSSKISNTSLKLDYSIINTIKL